MDVEFQKLQHRLFRRREYGAGQDDRTGTRRHPVDVRASPHRIRSAYVLRKLRNPNPRRPEFLRGLRIPREAARHPRRPRKSQQAAASADARGQYRSGCARAAVRRGGRTNSSSDGPRRQLPMVRRAIARGQTSCPRCGASLSMPEEVSPSGWAQLPGRKDMAKLQFGNSFCQIEGTYVPVADMKLAPEDSVYFTHHVLLWKDPQVNITTMSMRGGWKRLFAGLPLIMTQAQGPGPHRVFEGRSRRVDPRAAAAGRSDRRPRAHVPGGHRPRAIRLVQHRHLVHRRRTATIPKPTIRSACSWTASPRRRPPGCCCCTPPATSSCAIWAEQETILIKPKALVFKDPTVQMQLHFEQPSAAFNGWGSWGNRYMWLLLSGPGRVAIQSVYPPVEGENARITGLSRATQQQW